MKKNLWFRMLAFMLTFVLLMSIDGISALAQTVGEDYVKKEQEKKDKKEKDVTKRIKAFGLEGALCDAVVEGDCYYVYLEPKQTITVAYGEGTEYSINVQADTSQEVLDYVIYNEDGNISQFQHNSKNLSSLYCKQTMVITSNANSKIKISVAGKFVSNIVYRECATPALESMVLESGKSYELVNATPWEWTLKESMSGVFAEYALYEKKGAEYIVSGKNYGRGNELPVIPSDRKLIVTCVAEQNVTIYYPYTFTENGISIEESKYPALQKFTVESNKSYEIINHTKGTCTFWDNIDTNFLMYAYYMNRDDKYIPSTTKFGFTNDIQEIASGDKEIISSTLKQNTDILFPYTYLEDGLEWKEIQDCALESFIIEAGKSYEIINESEWEAAFQENISENLLQYAKYKKVENSYQPCENDFGTTSKIKNVNPQEKEVVTATTGQNITIYYPMMFAKDQLVIKETEQKALRSYVLKGKKNYEIINGTGWTVVFRNNMNKQFNEYAIYNKGEEGYIPTNRFGYSSEIEGMGQGQRQIITSVIDTDVTITVPYLTGESGLEIKETTETALQSYTIAAGKNYEINNGTPWTCCFIDDSQEEFAEYALYDSNYVQTSYFGSMWDQGNIASGYKEILTSIVEKDVVLRVPYLYGVNGLSIVESQKPALESRIFEKGKSYYILNGTANTVSMWDSTNNRSIEYAIYYEKDGKYIPNNEFGTLDSIYNIYQKNKWIVTLGEDVTVKFPQKEIENGLQIGENASPALAQIKMEVGKNYEVINKSPWACRFITNASDREIEYALYNKAGKLYVASMDYFGYSSGLPDMACDQKIVMSSNGTKSVNVYYPFEFTTNGMQVKEVEQPALYKMGIAPNKKYEFTNQIRSDLTFNIVIPKGNKMDLLKIAGEKFTLEEGIGEGTHTIKIPVGNSILLEAYESNADELIAYLPSGEKDNITIQEVDAEKLESIGHADFINYHLDKVLSRENNQKSSIVEDTLTNYKVELENKTTDKKIENATIMKDKIIVPSNTVNIGDTIQITIKGDTIATAVLSFTMKKSGSEIENFQVVEKGYVVPKSIIDTDKTVYMQVYNEEGKRIGYKSYTKESGVNEVIHLEQGNYKVIFLNTASQMWSITDLSEIEELELVQNRDYILQDIVVQDGQIYSIDISELANMDSSNMSCFDIKQTNLSVNKELVSGSELVEIRLNYKLKDAYQDRVKDCRVIFGLPEGINFKENSIMLGNSTPKYSVDINFTSLTVELNKAEGSLVFYVKPAEAGKVYTITSTAQYTYQSKMKTETLGQTEITVSNLSMTVPSITSNRKITVNGIGTPQKQVRVYINGENVIKTVTSKSGVWASKVTLPLTKEREYEIYATIVEGDKTLAKTSTRTVIYNEIAPEIDEFKMIYNGHTYDLLEYYESGARAKITFNSSKMTFVVHVKNGDNIESLKITSTRNGEEKSLSAEKDISGKWIATGWFDPGNHNYVPGYLNVKMKQARKNLFNNNITVGIKDIQSVVDAIPDETKKSIDVKIERNTKEELIGVAEYTNSETNQQQTFSYNIQNKTVNVTDITSQYLTNNNYTKVSDNTYVSYNINTKTGEEKSSIIYPVFDDSDKLTITSYAVTGLDGLLEAIGSKSSLIGDYSTALSVAGFTLDAIDSVGYGIDKYTQVMNSDLSPAKKAAAAMAINVATAAKLQVAAGSLAVALTASTITASGVAILAASGMAVAAGVLTFAGPLILCGAAALLANFLNDCIEDGLDKFLNGLFKIDWAIDPSGYVYEVIPENRLKGVKTTVFYQGEDGEPVCWDAEEYQQQNPLITDENGVYAWDVPEGLWQVKYEKEGYETVYSEWLPVPPPQTQVNIPMVSQEEGKIEQLVLQKKGIDIIFTKYMDAKKLTKEKVILLQEGKVIEASITPVDPISYEKKTIAKQFLLTPKQGSLEKEKEYSVVVKAGATTYADVELKKDITASQTYYVLPTDFLVETTQRVGYYGATSYVVNGKLESGEEQLDKKRITIQVESGDENVIVDNDKIIVNADGTVKIPVTIQLPVTTDLTIKVANTNIEKVVTLDTYIDPTIKDNQQGDRETVGKVKDFQVTKSTVNSISLKWSPDKNADGYILYYYDTKKKKDIELQKLEKKVSSFTVKTIGGKKIQKAAKYIFKIAAYQMNGDVKTIGEKVAVNGITKFDTVVIQKIKAAKRTMTIHWKKVNTMSGIEIYTSLKKNKGYKKVKTIKNKKSTSVKISNLKSGKRYYVKLRAYKIVDGKKIFGDYSKIKSVKMKK